MVFSRLISSITMISMSIHLSKEAPLSLTVFVTEILIYLPGSTGKGLA
jgi:hypothetical protein